MLQLCATSPADTHAIAAAVAVAARRGDIIVLAGEMGAGKTAFAQGFGSAFGVDEPVTSPTYTLVHSYGGGRLPMHHADLYRLGSHHEVADLALGELADEGVVLVEWGDAVAGDLGDHLQVRLAHVDGDEQRRHIELSAIGRAWSTRWIRLGESLARFAC